MIGCVVVVSNFAPNVIVTSSPTFPLQASVASVSYTHLIEDVFDDEVFNSTFWLYWRTMFAFENWHSALEMKLYFQRFIHHIAGLPDFSALKFTKYNQYESLILPMQKYLENAGVDFQFNTEVTNVAVSYTHLT